VNQVESGYAKRIFELLEPIVGKDNLRATVAADIDFSQTEATSEEFKPNQGADASVSIRSQQTTEQGGAAGGALPSGVPGAASNQPPIAATAPLTGASQPLQAAPLAGGTGSGGRREAVTNYEVDKTVRVTRNASGTVKRVNAAVVVNHGQVVDAKGKKTAVPLTAEEMDKLTALVKESIGFKQERGDSVKVINAPFKVDPAATAVVATPWWRAPDTLDLVRAAGLPGGAGDRRPDRLLRPGAAGDARRARPEARAEAGGRLDAIADDADALPALPSPAVRTDEHIASARQLARSNPAAVAGILRNWVDGSESAAASAKG
jgi:flagellar M-ring protein FliF